MIVVDSRTITQHSGDSHFGTRRILDAQPGLEHVRTIADDGDDPGPQLTALSETGQAVAHAFGEEEVDLADLVETVLARQACRGACQLVGMTTQQITVSLQQQFPRWLVAITSPSCQFFIRWGLGYIG